MEESKKQELNGNISEKFSAVGVKCVEVDGAFLNFPAWNVYPVPRVE